MSSVKWSPHAESLLEEIVLGIATALYPDDGIRWELKLREAAEGLGDFPLSHPTIPVECYHTVPPNPERLHQLIVKPYRIVYEIVESEVHCILLFISAPLCVRIPLRAFCGFGGSILHLLPIVPIAL